jgi:hypothetical protein
VSPVIDGKASWTGLEAAVKNHAWVLVESVEVHNTLGSNMAMEHQQSGTFVEEEGKPLVSILDHGLVCLLRNLRDFRDSTVVPIGVVGRKVLLRGRDNAQGRNAMVENAREIIYYSLVNIGLPEFGQGVR